MRIYRVSNWSNHFENNRTRELKRLDWVPVPNKHDGDGFTDLMSRPNGVALFGAWNLILQLASKCSPRGTLVRQNPAGGCDMPPIPHTAASISRITRCPEEIVIEALSALIEIGWIDVVESDSNDLHNGSENPAGGCGKIAGGCGPSLPFPSIPFPSGKGSGKGDFETPSWEEFKAYCDMHGGPVEWYSRDKFLAAEAKGWSGISKWTSYADRIRGWWEGEGRPMKPGKQQPQKKKFQP